MAVFPEDIKISYPIDVEPEWKTQITTMKGGIEVRRALKTFATYNVSFKSKVITKDEIQTLWAFYMNRKGALEQFYFYVPNEIESYTDLFIGYGDGSTTVFDIPGKSITSGAIYLNGTELTYGTDVTFLIGGGDGNSDRVQFASAPSWGDLATCDITGKLRIPCRFKSDKLKKSTLAYQVYSTGVKLQGLPFA